MKENFETALAFTLKQEGGYVNNPRDPGGKTFRGITQRTLNMFRSKLDKEPEDVRNLSADEIAQIYKTYWDAIQGDTVAPGADLVMFDIAVMSGPARAEEFYTHGAHTYDTLNAAHASFLRRLTTWPTFGHGWTNRINARERAALTLIKPPIPPAPVPVSRRTGSPTSMGATAIEPDERAFTIGAAVRSSTAALREVLQKIADGATPQPSKDFDGKTNLPKSELPNLEEDEQEENTPMNEDGILGTMMMMFHLATTAAPLVPHVVSDVGQFISDVNTVSDDFKTKGATAAFGDLEKAFEHVATDWSDVTAVIAASSGKSFKLKGV